MSAVELLRQGKLQAAYESLQDQVRKNPSDAKLRVFLFQILAVQGQWDRALTQLNVSAELDAAALAMAQMYREALQCEVLRAEVFAGKRSPLVLGQPPDWIGPMLEALRLTADGNHAAAGPCRASALDSAPTTSGVIDGQRFAWLADADSRLGPVVEAIVNGRYYWVPVQNIRQIMVEKPADLRDLVWTPVHFTWVNEGEMVGLIPTRYPGSEHSSDEAVRMARRTDWSEVALAGVYLGAGQRMWATDVGDFALLETRQVDFGEGASPADTSGDRGMTELALRERLQPSLLDRLTDDEPHKKVESREKRAVSLEQLRRSVLRDLAWLLNTGNFGQTSELADFPEVASSVLNRYGAPDLSGRTISSADCSDLEAALWQAIVDFEPRLLRHSLKVRAAFEESSMNLKALTFEIEGALWAQPVPLQLFLKTEFDLETGHVSVTERAPT